MKTKMDLVTTAQDTLVTQMSGAWGIENGEGGDGCPPPFVDADGDGVQDSDDDCPDTATGLTVNPEDGCEVDSDGDGVVDSEDDCPFGTNVTVRSTRWMRSC